MSIKEREAQIVQEFVNLATWEERYRKIIELGKALPSLPDSLKTDEAKVKGCQSQVWLHAELNGQNQIEFRGDSDALIVRGLVALLLKVYSGETPADILTSSPEFIKTLGFAENLSPSRANGLNSMLRQLKFFAMAFQYQLQLKK